MISIHDQQINDYIYRFPERFEIDPIKNIKVETLPQGVWNFNYLVTVNHQEKLVFKLYPDSKESMIGNSGLMEFLCLQAFIFMQIAPIPLFFDDSCIHFQYPCLVYKYVIGETLNINEETLIKTARLFAKLHSFNPSSLKSIKKRNDFKDELINKIEKMLHYYGGLKNTNINEFKVFSNFINQVKYKLKNAPNYNYKESLLHADPVPGNFIMNQEKVVLIDWQTPMLSDPAFDICLFLSEPFQLWDLDSQITKVQKQIFLNEYIQITQDREIEKRMNQKKPLYLLEFGLHCLIRYSDYLENKVNQEIAEGRKLNFEKYNTSKNIVVDILQNIL
ncbi:phosphotransferase [Coleofasciculus sp. E2-BRE-01]|uniref:phosphotransferase n=1 Tax=Coleofasciculus sp. E2-BRE-01 TaxID=3069524 RepID=UPI0032F2B9C2